MMLRGDPLSVLLVLLMATLRRGGRHQVSTAAICIGAGDFKRIDVSPPQDHRYVYFNMREADTIL